MANRLIESVVDETVQDPASGNGKHSNVPKSLGKRRARATAPRSRRPRHSGNSRRRGRKPYPVITFEEALKIGRGIFDHAGGKEIKRTTLLGELGLSDNQSTRDLITNSAKYGITTGARDAEDIELTELGKSAVDESISTVKRHEARFELAITRIEPFKKLFEKYTDTKLPSPKVMQDQLVGIDEGDRAPCVDVFVQNLKFLGLLQQREGAEFIHRAVDSGDLRGPSVPKGKTAQPVNNAPAGSAEDFDTVCFFIAPIGEDGTEVRRHSNAILASYLERSLENVEPRLRVVRADKIETPGMISKQMIEYVVKSRLVVADLSYLNPNVFYELCLRHVTGKPVIHLKRQSDSIPFDTGNFRTIEIKFDDKFDVLAELETVRSTIASYARQALSVGSSSDNPVLAFCPGAKFSIAAEVTT